jgi:hypothetical protein
MLRRPHQPVTAQVWLVGAAGDDRTDRVLGMRPFAGRSQALVEFGVTDEVSAGRLGVEGTGPPLGAGLKRSHGVHVPVSGQHGQRADEEALMVARRGLPAERVSWRHGAIAWQRRCESRLLAVSAGPPGRSPARGRAARRPRAAGARSGALVFSPLFGGVAPASPCGVASPQAPVPPVAPLRPAATSEHQATNAP